MSTRDATKEETAQKVGAVRGQSRRKRCLMVSYDTTPTLVSLRMTLSFKLILENST